MRKHQRYTIFFGSFVIVIMAIFYFSSHTGLTRTAASTIDNSGLMNSSVQAQGTESFTANEQSYILMQVESGEILAAQNGDLKRPPASTTKLLSGLVAMQTLQQDEIVQVGEEVQVEGSRLGLQPGDRIAVHDLLTAMYLTSANDAAAAIAVKASGSIPAFAQEMNDYATSLGAQNSHFTNPHGLSDPEHYTTAADLMKIAKDFIQNEELMDLVQQSEGQVEWVDSNGTSHKAILQNTNQLVGLYPGAKGLKTGTTQEAGQCLVTYATSPDGDLLLVLLGSEQRYKDTVYLLDEGRSELRVRAAMSNISADPTGLFTNPGFFVP